MRDGQLTDKKKSGRKMSSITYSRTHTTVESEQIVSHGGHSDSECGKDCETSH